jgi:hypothetical protein
MHAGHLGGSRRVRPCCRCEGEKRRRCASGMCLFCVLDGRVRCRACVSTAALTLLPCSDRLGARTPPSDGTPCSVCYVLQPAEFLLNRSQTARVSRRCTTWSRGPAPACQRTRLGLSCDHSISVLRRSSSNQPSRVLESVSDVISAVHDNLRHDITALRHAMRI